MKTITTHATAATVYRWATQGSKRLRAKYRHAETVCRVLNRREAPIMGLDPAGTYGHIGCIKLSWGYGHIRECGPVDDCALGMRTEASVPPWGSGESLAVYRLEMSPAAWAVQAASVESMKRRRFAKSDRSSFGRACAIANAQRGQSPYCDGAANIVLAAEMSGDFVQGSVDFDAATNTLTGTLTGAIISMVIDGTLEV